MERRNCLGMEAIIIIKEPARDKTNKTACVSKNQIRLEFAVRTRKGWILSCILSTQQRL